MKRAMNNLDPYVTLGVDRTASADEIKRAYRRLAKQYHPDSTGGDKEKESKFKEVSTAYDILGDSGRRQQYDSMRDAPRFSDGFGGGMPDGIFDLGDLFAQMFSGAQPHTPGQNDARYRVYRGGSDPLGGGGFASTMPGFGVRADPPKRKKPARPPKEERIRASDGSPLVRRGKKIYSDVLIDFDQAVLGAVVEVPTVSGKASVKIPPGTSSGVKLRLRGKGAKIAGSKPGDHFVTVQINVPTAVDDKDKERLVELMRGLRRNR